MVWLFCLSISSYSTFLPPVNCGVPHAPENVIIENIQSICTVGGAQIFFRCNPGYVPAGRTNATCRSPDGLSVVGTWTPDPADLVCNGEIKSRHKSDETPLGPVLYGAMQDTE